MFNSFIHLFCSYIIGPLEEIWYLVMTQINHMTSPCHVLYTKPTIQEHNNRVDTNNMGRSSHSISPLAEQD